MDVSSAPIAENAVFIPDNENRKQTHLQNKRMINPLCPISGQHCQKINPFIN
jgi:hypothetical protein